jgi:hypothetical protein
VRSRPPTENRSVMYLESGIGREEGGERRNGLLERIVEH